MCGVSFVCVACGVLNVVYHFHLSNISLCAKIWIMGMWGLSLCSLFFFFPLSLSQPKKWSFPIFSASLACHFFFWNTKLRNFEQFFYNKPAYLQNSVAECWKPNDTLVFHYVFLSNRCSSPCWWKDASYGHVLIKTTGKVHQQFSKFYSLYNYDPDLEGILLHYYCGFPFQ